MPKVLLLGDSIRMSYCERVAELLGDGYDVSWPAENCRFTTHTLFYLDTWIDNQQYDLIQWNNGQWDTARMQDGRPLISLEQYVANTQRIYEVARPFGKQFVFATTTPVHGDMAAAGAARPRTNEDIHAYNDAACETLVALGVKILDLNKTVIADTKTYLKDDRVHLTPDGVDVCAQAVAANIKSMLG